MRRILVVLTMALVMAAMMLTVTAPAMSQSPCPAEDFPGARPQPNVVVPGEEFKPPVFFNCVERGTPGEPPGTPGQPPG
jgi:hypothetical protein